MPPKIIIRDLKRTFFTRENPGGLTALAGVSLGIEESEFTCILGPSGCGKTTILNILSGLDTDYEGEILIKGQPVSQAGGPRVSYVFQEPRLLPWLTVEGNVAFALHCHGVPLAGRRETIHRYLALVGLKEFEGNFPHQLSGGMQQRASIARSLAIEPELLLMDEPFSGLDEITGRRLRRELLEIWHKTRVTILFVTHNPFEASFLGDRILLMTQRPGSIYKEVPVPLARPRDYEDPCLFDFNRELVRDFLGYVGEGEL